MLANQAFSNLPLTPLQSIVFDYRGQVMKATVRSVSTLEGVDGDTMGIIMEGTEIQWFKDPASAIKLKNSSNRYVVHVIYVKSLGAGLICAPCSGFSI